MSYLVACIHRYFILVVPIFMASIYTLAALKAFSKFGNQIFLSVSQCICSYGHFCWQNVISTF
jgi:hypothetical protein